MIGRTLPHRKVAQCTLWTSSPMHAMDLAKENDRGGDMASDYVGSIRVRI